jgi:hypothetical protein
MRFIAAALLVFACPPLLVAGQRPEPVVVPPPSIGLPLPPIGLPLPPLGLQPPQETPPLDSRHPPHVGPPFWPRHPIVFFGAPYAWGIDESLQSPTPGVIASPVEERARAASGYLRLEVEPEHLVQIFLDGEYVGTPADYAGEIPMAPGSWRVELRAPGYDTVSFDVRISPDRTVTYRGALVPSPLSPPPASPSTPPADTTFYLIPGCYMGNVPPDRVKLPPGCDPSRVIIHKPVR